jgi:hypothetical protein
MSTIGNIASTLLHAVLPINLFPGSTTASSGAVTASSTLTQQPDTGHLSSFAQLIGALQQVQQANPAQYQQITQQIAVNLQSAAQAAQAGGNTAAAAHLNQLASDFTNASASGQLPNLQDLANAVGGGHHHIGSTTQASSGSPTSGSPTFGSPTFGSPSTGSATGTANQALLQFLASGQFSGTSDGSLNAASIIQSALTSAGIGKVGS